MYTLLIEKFSYGDYEKSDEFTLDSNQLLLYLQKIGVKMDNSFFKYLSKINTGNPQEFMYLNNARIRIKRSN